VRGRGIVKLIIGRHEGVLTLMFFDSAGKVINELVESVDRVVRKRGSII